VASGIESLVGRPLEYPDDSTIDSNETVDVRKRLVNVDPARVGIGRGVDTTLRRQVAVAADYRPGEEGAANESDDPLTHSVVECRSNALVQIATVCCNVRWTSLAGARGGICNVPDIGVVVLFLLRKYSRVCVVVNFDCSLVEPKSSDAWSATWTRDGSPVI
jgi:hypothetical protein